MKQLLNSSFFLGGETTEVWTFRRRQAGPAFLGRLLPLVSAGLWRPEGSRGQGALAPGFGPYAYIVLSRASNL